MILSSYFMCVSPIIYDMVSLQKQDWSQVITIESAAECAKAVVNGICRGKTFLAEPSWVRALFWLSNLCPKLIISKPKRK